MYSKKAVIADINHASKRYTEFFNVRDWCAPYAKLCSWFAGKACLAGISRLTSLYTQNIKGRGVVSIRMGESMISTIELIKSSDEYLPADKIEIRAQFSIRGGLRDAFNEANWTKAYNSNDVSFKMKYGVKLTSGGFRKKELGRTIDTYRKASIFWTRNPKLVNPMKDRRIWVQVAKNFEPFIRLTEEEVKAELFDFDEKFVFNAADLGVGKHKISAEAFASWQKHDYTEQGSIKNSSDEIEIAIK